MNSSVYKTAGALVAIAAIAAALVHLVADTVRTGLLDYSVDPPLQIAFLETPWLYMLLMGFSFVSVLVLSFDRRVAFYKKWKYLIPGFIFVSLPFIVWDVLFTYREVWGFNPDYFLGIRFLHLPIEEWLFFLVIPFACIFIYENVRVKVPGGGPQIAERWISPMLIATFLVLGVLSWGRSYSAITYLLTGGIYLLHYLWGSARFRSYFLLSYLWCLLPFMLVDGGLTGIATQAPVVVYNPEEFMGWRMWTIPVDDAVYGFLLIFGVAWLYERRVKRLDSK